MISAHFLKQQPTQTILEFAKLRAMRACMPAWFTCQIFNHSSCKMLKEICILYYYTKNSTLCICICIVHKNCVILHFYTSCHIKAKCVEFCLLKLFCSLFRNKNIKIWFLYVTSNKGLLEFYTVKTTKQHKEYVWVLWSSWIVICLSLRHEIVMRNR